MPNTYQDPRSYVTPGAFSQDALSFKRQQESIGRNVFTKAYEKLPNADCDNCQNHGMVIVTSCSSGPHKNFPVGRLATWFEGDERSGPGWYVIHQTKRETIGPDGKVKIITMGSICFPCPVCQNIAQEERESALPDYANW